MKEEEQQKWLAEGHSHGLCLSMVAHAHELLRSTVVLEEAEVQTEMATWSDASTQAAPRTDETATQTNDEPKHWCTAMQTELSNNKSPTLTKTNAQMTFHTTPKINETTTQTKTDPATSPLVTDAQLSSTTTTLLSTTTTTSSPAPKLPPAP